MASLEKASTRERKKQAYTALERYLTDNERVLRRMKNRLEDAFALAERRCRYNFRTIIPCYVQKGETVGFLMPLTLAEDGITDAALLLREAEDGTYVAETVWEPERAYVEARVLAPLAMDWMLPDTMGEEPNRREMAGAKKGSSGTTYFESGKNTGNSYAGSSSSGSAGGTSGGFREAYRESQRLSKSNS